MNIVLINHYAGSTFHGMEYRPYYMAKSWMEQGHKVTIIGASYSHVRTNQPDIREIWTNEEVNGVNYVWLKTPEYEGNGAKRAFNMFTFVKRLYQFKDKIVNEFRPDAVIASSTYPLDIYPAAKIARQANAKLFFEVHDLWPLSPMELSNMSPYHPFIFVMQRAENYAYRKSDKVISLLPKAKEHMIQHGMDPNKFVYLPNGIVVDDWKNFEGIPEEHEHIISRLKNEGKFLVGYAGTHGLANALLSLIEAAKLLQDHPISFVLVGKGPERDRLINEARKHNLNNIYFLPVIPKKSIPDFLSKMDALYIGLRRTSLFRFGVSPNKLLDYMMAAKPIIHGIDAGNDLVEEAGCGISIEPEEPTAIAEAVLKMLGTSDEQRQEWGKNGKDYVLEHHEYNVLATQFLNCIQKTINE